MVAAAVPLLVSASESPDRECCDGPSYKLEPGAGRGQEASFPRYNYPPPEVPDFPEYGPHEQMPPRVPGYGPGKLGTYGLWVLTSRIYYLYLCIMLFTLSVDDYVQYK